MKKKDFILGYFNSICDNSIKQKDLNHLIELMVKTAYSYLKHRLKNQYKILLAEDVTLKELAIDSIALLFKRDDNGCFVKLKTAFENWQPPISNEQEAEFFLNKLVSKSVEQNITEILRGSDPFFAKIHHSLIYLALKQNIIKKHFLGTTYFLEENIEIIPGYLPDISFIKTLPDKLFLSKETMFKEIFNYIKSNTNYLPAIALNAMVLKIKEIKSYEHKLPEICYQDWEFEIESIVNKSLKITLNRLENTYERTGKLSHQEVSNIRIALESYAEDLKNGGVNIGVYNYLFEKVSDLTESEYLAKYKNILEYLIKFLKKNIVDELEKK